MLSTSLGSLQRQLQDVNFWRFVPRRTSTPQLLGFEFRRIMGLRERDGRRYCVTVDAVGEPVFLVSLSDYDTKPDPVS